MISLNQPLAYSQKYITFPHYCIAYSISRGRSSYIERENMLNLVAICIDCHLVYNTEDMSSVPNSYRLWNASLPISLLKKVVL